MKILLSLALACGVIFAAGKVDLGPAMSTWIFKDPMDQTLVVRVRTDKHPSASYSCVGLNDWSELSADGYIVSCKYGVRYRAPVKLAWEIF